METSDSFFTNKKYEKKDMNLFRRRQMRFKPKRIKVATKDLRSAVRSFTCETTPYYEYDVFLSYSSNDTGFSFSSHLSAAFSRRGIRVLESLNLSQGSDVVPPEVPEGIEKSRVLVVVFSENYASSRWCLDELVKILKCDRQRRMVLPVFYEVDPLDVRNQSGAVGEAFARLERWTERVKTRKDALPAIASLPCFVSREIQDDSKLVDWIVREVLRRLPPPSDYNDLVGINLRLHEILLLLRIESPDFRIIGIWGSGGIGKTTIAEGTFKNISGEYEACYFLRDFDVALRTKGIYQLQEELFATLLGEEKLGISTFYIKQDFAKDRLRRRKILVVLDDVRNYRDLESLVGRLDWFGPGSRIIITTRDRQVLIRCQVNEIYEAGELNKSESLQLFCQNAFRENHPEKQFLEQTMNIVNYVDGNPLALRVLGSNLCGRSLNQWERALLILRQNPMDRILDVLKSSYDALDDNEKTIFLDLACFFRGEHEDVVTRLLDGCDCFAHVGISILIDKSLISILNNRVEMHNLHEGLGREIVRRESAEPGKRSRLWDHEEIRYILTNDKGTETIEAIFLDMTNTSFELSPTAFKNMYRLRLLKIHGFSLKSPCRLFLPQGLDCLPDELRLLHWENYPLRSLPCSFDPSNLVELNLFYSDIEKLWKGTKNLEKLKKIRLSHSQRLTKMPRLSKAHNLELLDLEGCKNLVKISSSICYLDKLVFLNMRDCSNLRSLPSTVHLESLEVLNLSGCSQLEKFPEVSPNLKELYLGGSSIRKVPSSVECLTKLVNLDMENCRRLENLPTSISKLKSLSKLNLSGCSSLENFPKFSETMKSLWFLDLSRTAIKGLPSSISFLIALQELRIINCKNLVKLPDNLRKLKALRKVEHHDADAHWITHSGKDLVSLENVYTSRFKDQDPAGSLPRVLSSLHSLASRLYYLVKLSLRRSDVMGIPEDLCGLLSLDSLDLSGNGFQEIPAEIRQLSNLMNLSISTCRRLKSVPELPRCLSYLDAHSCTSLGSVSWNSKQSFMGFLVTECLNWNPYLPVVLSSAFMKKQESLGFSKASSFTTCFPMSAWPGLLNFLFTGSSFSFSMPPYWQNHSLLGFAFSVVVAFDKNFYSDSGFGIRCICNLKTQNSAIHSLERTLFCWCQSKDDPKIRRDHMFIFYDQSMLKSIAVENVNKPIMHATFEFYPVDVQNMLLPGCKVTRCAVYMLTGEHEKSMVVESVNAESRNQKSINLQSDFSESSTVKDNQRNFEPADQRILGTAAVGAERSLGLDDSQNKEETKSK